MKKHIYCLIWVFACIMLSGCNLQKRVTDERKSTDYSNISNSFEVQIDKNALEIGEEKRAIVFIFTDSLEWEYFVQTEYGKISNRGNNSFEYIVPEEKEDTIIIQLIDYENAVQCEYVIPLFFTDQGNEIKVPIDPDTGELVNKLSKQQAKDRRL